MAANGLKIVFGGASLLQSSAADVTAWLKVLDELKIKIIDTAALYGASESSLGEAGAAKSFAIDTKLASGFGGALATKDNVIAAFRESLAKLQTDSIDVYYLHAPDRRVPFKETLSGLDVLYKEGSFKRLGLSNFLGKEVDEIVRVAKENNYVVPSVYQGNYSAVARRADNEIFPVLRKHNIAFYAYSPIAGGFLAKSKAALTEVDGRFGANNPLSQVYNGMYNRPSFIQALGVWEQIANDEGVAKAELAYRWAAYHSKLSSDSGDAIIVGASRESQLRQTVEALQKGPLSDGAVKKIDEIWDSVKADASLDNFEMLTSQ